MLLESKQRQKGKQVVSVEADLVPRLRFLHGGANIKQVRLLVTMKRDGPKVSIHADDLPWLVAYIADEVGFGGVVQEPEEDSAVAEPNSSVPGLRVECDFQAHGPWCARLAGPLVCQACGFRAVSLLALLWPSGETEQ